jgi:perosamine synthetase
MKNSIKFFYPKKTNFEISILKKTLNSKFFNEGKVTRRFENKIKLLTKRRYAVCNTSGTISLSIALLSNNIGHGDEVIIPSFTYVATANAVTLTGAKVILADVCMNNFTIDEKKLSSLITNKTKAVISVEVNGRSPKYEILSQICKKKKILLITDSTEALGSYYNSKPLGSYGDISCFSFSPSKIISTGQGGALVTNNKLIYQRALLLKKQGIEKGTGGGDVHKHLGYNFKYTDIQASIGIAQLMHFKKRLKQFIFRDKIYIKCLKNIIKKGIIILPEKKRGSINLWFDILVPDFIKLKILKKEFKKKGIQYRTFWNSINKHNYYYSKKKFNISNYISRHGIWLPSNFDLNQKKIKYICEVIIRILANSYNKKNK